MSDSPWWEDLLREFERANSQWTVRELLGEGNSAAVFKVSCDTRDAAVKVYKPEFFQGENAAVERHRIALHEKLRGHACPSLVQILAVGELTDSAFVLMEYIPWPTLDVVIGATPTESIPAIISDVSAAAAWLHEQQLVHRDIKPANILISPDFSSAKLVDLGVIRTSDSGDPRLTDHGRKRPFVATAQYSSPEYLFRLVAPSPELWLGLTIYQLGAVLQDMLTGKALFHDEVSAQNRYILAMAVLRQMPLIKRKEGVPVRWAALARRALEKDLVTRLRAVRLSDFMNLEILDLEAARRSLGLDGAEALNLLSDVDEQRKRAQLLQKNLVAQVRDAMGHRLRAEGYRRVRWIELDEQSAWISLEIPGHDHVNCSVRVRLTLDTSRVVVHAGAQLAAVDGVGECRAEELFWEGALEHFSDELGTDLIPLISEYILVKYSKALDTSTVGIATCDLPLSLGDK